jgi:ABC-type transport system substrate-binding protein
MKRAMPFLYFPFLAVTVAQGAVFPGPNYVEEPDPYASPYAQVGGTLNYAGTTSPQSLNCFIDNNTFSHMVFGLMYPTLLGSDAVTDDLAPGLAKQWEISEDKRTFTFVLDERAKWSDGKPYTTKDVKKTFDTIKNPYCSNPYLVVLSEISCPEILDERTVRFTASEIHWQNIYKIGSNIYIMPAHFIEAEEAKVRASKEDGRLREEAVNEAAQVAALFTEVEAAIKALDATQQAMLMPLLPEAKGDALKLSELVKLAKTLPESPLTTTLNEKLSAYSASTKKFDNRQILDADELYALKINAAAFKNICFEFPIVGGPYRLERHDPGKEIVLKRRADWWVFQTVSGQGVYNFDTVKIRFFLSHDNALEAFKKGEVDMIPIYSARQWEKETSGEKFYKNWIVKQKINNLCAVGFQGVVMNMRKYPYNDIRVRKALAHLFDSRRMVNDLMYNAYDIYGSFFEDLYDREDVKHLRPKHVEFDLDEAHRLLTEAGFKIDLETGKMLMPNGEPFVIDMLINQKSSETFLAVYKNALLRLGIDMKITLVDFGAWMNKTGNLDYDVTNCAFSGSIFRDPEPMWHSRNKDTKMGVNRAGYANEKVDVLIDAMKEEFSFEKRNEMLREIDKMLTDDVPYILTWYIRATRLLYWNKFGTPANVLGKRGDEMSIPAYWWYDTDSAAELEHAMKEGLPLPARDPNPQFKETKRSLKRMERNAQLKAAREAEAAQPATSLE